MLRVSTTMNEQSNVKALPLVNAFVARWHIGLGYSVELVVCISLQCILFTIWHFYWCTARKRQLLCIEGHVKVLSSEEYLAIFIFSYFLGSWKHCMSEWRQTRGIKQRSHPRILKDLGLPHEQALGLFESNGWRASETLSLALGSCVYWQYFRWQTERFKEELQYPLQYLAPLYHPSWYTVAVRGYIYVQWLIVSDDAVSEGVKCKKHF